MDYEPFKVSYTAGQPYVGATLSMYPPQGESHMGNFIAGMARRQDRLVEQGAVLGVVGALATAGGRGVLRNARRLSEGSRCQTGKELYKFKTPSGIIGNVTTYENGGRQYVAVLSGVGGWAGIGLAAGLN